MQSVVVSTKQPKAFGAQVTTLSVSQVVPSVAHESATPAQGSTGVAQAGIAPVSSQTPISGVQSVVVSTKQPIAFISQTTRSSPSQARDAVEQRLGKPSQRSAMTHIEAPPLVSQVPPADAQSVVVSNKQPALFSAQMVRVSPEHDVPAASHRRGSSSGQVGVVSGAPSTIPPSTIPPSIVPMSGVPSSSPQAIDIMSPHTASKRSVLLILFCPPEQTPVWGKIRFSLAHAASQVTPNVPMAQSPKAHLPRASRERRT